MNRLALAARRVGRAAPPLFLAAVLATAPAVSAAERGGDRPFRGTLGGEITFHFDWDDPVCPVTTVTRAAGVASHLGAVTTTWSHCPPVVLPGYTDGHVTFTAADGDTVVGAYEDADGDVPFVIDIVGGSGRFAGARGTITVWFVADGPWGDDGLPVNPWTWSATFAGTLTY